MSSEDANQNNNNVWDKFILICKPEQSGKTFIMIKMINEELNNHDSNKTVINFIFCDNSLLLTKQTANRVKNDVDKLPDIEESYVEFSSRNDGFSAQNSAEVIAKITCDDVTNIICCTNGKRVSDISSIIKRLNRKSDNREKYIFKIWLDEADKFIGHIDKTFIGLAEQHNNVYTYCLTATPKQLFTKYNYMNVLPLENTTSPEYHGWKDNRIKIIDHFSSTSEFIGFSLQEHLDKGGKFEPGSKWFTPADSKKASHKCVRDILLGKEFAVFIVNGDGICLTLPTTGKPTYTENKTKELHEQLYEMYISYNVSRFPVAITGNICVSRGISIMHQNFIFDYAILSNCNNKAEASQSAGRLKGNIKKWSNYKRPMVYTTSKFNKIATEWEEKSRELAILAFNKGGKLLNLATVITKYEHKFMITDKKWKLYTKEFNTLEDANKYLIMHKFKIHSEEKFEKKKINGFIQSTTTKKLSVLQYDAVKNELKSWGKETAFDLRNDKRKYSRMIVCYKDLNDVNSVQYIVRIIKRKKILNNLT